MMSPTLGGTMMNRTRGGMMMSPTRGRVKGSAQGEVENHAHGEGQGAPPHGLASRDVQKSEEALGQRPAKTQEKPHDLMDMRDDQLNLESDIMKGGPVPTDNQLPPQQEEEIEEAADQVAYSSNEGDEDKDGTPREGDQKKKRKRDVKYDEKHPKD